MDCIKSAYSSHRSPRRRGLLDELTRILERSHIRPVITNEQRGPSPQRQVAHSASEFDGGDGFVSCLIVGLNRVMCRISELIECDLLIFRCQRVDRSYEISGAK